jgi:hypothetical protein
VCSPEAGRHDLLAFRAWKRKVIEDIKHLLAELGGILAVAITPSLRRQIGGQGSALAPIVD